MPVSATTLKLLVDHVVDKVALIAIVAAIDVDMSADVRGLSADSPRIDEATERRRQYDRDRAQARRESQRAAEIRRQSADSPRTSDDKGSPASPPSLSPLHPPITTPTTTPSNKLSVRERGHRVPDDFWPGPTSLAKADKLGIPVDRELVDSFLDFWRAVPGAKARKLDWDATFRNRLDFLASRKPQQNGHHRNGSERLTLRDSWAEAERYMDERASRKEGGSGDHAALSGLSLSTARISREPH